MTLEEIIAALQQCSTELQAILDAQTTPTADAMKTADELVKRIAELEEKKLEAEKLISLKAANEERLKLLTKAAKPLPAPGNVNQPGAPAAQPALSVSSRRASKFYASEAEAYKAGRFFQAVIGDSESAHKYLAEQGVDLKALVSTVEGGAGLFVLPEVEVAIIKLLEEYGVARKLAKNITTKSDSKKTFKRVSGNTAYWLTETGQPTSTDAVWQTLVGTPKVLGALTKYSLILDADSAATLADEITQELAYALTIAEDQACFVGDGTSTYGGVVGACYAFRRVLEAAGGTWTNDTHKGYLASAVVAAGNAYSEVTLQNFIDTKNKVAKVAGIKPVWLIHDVTAAATMERLQYALSGNSVPNVTEGVPAKFLGYPVVYVNAMPSVEANSQVVALFGDLGTAANFYDRQGVEIATNTQSETNFLSRTAQVLATERLDFVCHDVGNYNATAASRKRGTLAALISANS